MELVCGTHDVACWLLPIEVMVQARARVQFPFLLRGQTTWKCVFHFILLAY